MTGLANIHGISIPESLAGALARYILHRIPTGSFLEAVLSNDLKEAVGRADSQSEFYLTNLVRVMYNRVPLAAQGSPEIVAEWLNGELDDDTKAAIESHYGDTWKEHLQS